MPHLRTFAGLDRDDPHRAQLRDKLVLGFLPVAEHLARGYSRGYPGVLDDLTQVATVGLISAIDRWDPALARGEFLGYLIPCVRGEIQRYFRDRTWSMRVTRTIKDLAVSIRGCTATLAQQLGRSPRPSELATYLGVAVEDVIEAISALNNQHVGSLDAVLDSEEPANSLGERLGQCDPGLELVECRQALRPLLDTLPARERAIVLMRFFGEMTQAQIAERIGISQMHVSRLLARTLTHLRQRLLDDGDGDSKVGGAQAAPRGELGKTSPTPASRNAAGEPAVRTARRLAVDRGLSQK